jgi:hypothetical protein
LFNTNTPQTFPTGFITQPLYFDGRRIETPLKKHINQSNYDEMFYMLNIAYDAGTFGTRFVDFFLLTEGLSEEELEILNYNQFNMNREDPPCCWDFVDGQTYFKDLVTGYARIIIHDESQGILSF